MDPFHFACPHCSAPLRVRDKLYVGRHVDCPECKQSLRIVETKEGLGIERLERVAPATNSPAGLAPAVSQLDPGAPRPDSSVRTSRRRLLIATSVVGISIVCAVIVHYISGNTETGSVDQLAVADQNDGPQIAKEPNPPADVPPQNDQPPRTELEQRLSHLGQRLLDVAATDGSFPAGTVPILGIPAENRLSWMALLVESDDPASAPDPVWDRPWNAPQNEPFVRRRLTGFQNSAIAELTGEDGYPASHFVGVAGVGPDAARLDHRSARAGIFGYNRRTRLKDIPDGASNTLMVLGVRDQLGSWAAGGPATVRGLTREPYINGPDGFGTGSADAMDALLADGHVMSINSQIDPRILRRMAAKADGFTLDDPDTGEPGDRPVLLVDALADDGEGSGEPEPHPLAENDRPITPEFAPEPAPPAVKKIDLAVSLKQPILRFDQPRSKPLAEVLVSVAEMAGTTIVYDRDELGSAAAHLQEPMALKLERTTVGDILTGLLRPAGLAYRVDGDHLRLVPRAAE
jgi:hypothetical protein